MSDQERLERALDDVAAGRSPRGELPALDAEEQRLVRMAQLIAGSRAASPDEDFVGTLRDRLSPGPARVTRRAAFLSGIGAVAAGLLAGVGIDHAIRTEPREQSTAAGWEPVLVGKHGTWMRVASVADVPDGAITTFSAGHVNGFLMNRGGKLRAISRMCTDMGCALDIKTSGSGFTCPCHGAEFELDGTQRYTTQYRRDLPPLPPLGVRVNGDAIEVWSV